MSAFINDPMPTNDSFAMSIKSCPPPDYIGIKGTVHLKLRDKQQNIIYEHTTNNLVVAVGRAKIINMLGNTEPVMRYINQISLGTGGAPGGSPFNPYTPSASDTALAAEITAASAYPGSNTTQLATPTSAPTLTTSGSGSALTTSVYYVVFTWTTAVGETAKSPEASISVTAGQNIVVTTPALPTGATGIKVYAATATGGEVYSGASATNTYTISTAPAGAAAPLSNTTQVTTPTTAATLAVSATAGSLSAVTWYVKYTWITAIGETATSPEASLVLTSANTSFTVSVPAFPTGVTSAKVYVANATNAETYNGTIATTGTTLTVTVQSQQAARMNITSSSFPTITSLTIVGIFQSSVINNNVNEAGAYLFKSTDPSAVMFARVCFPTVALQASTGSSLEIDWTFQA